MDYVKLGSTDLEVGKLALGGLFVASFISEFEGARRTVERALELGINYIDTAPGYGNSEEVLGKALPGSEKPVVLSTKLGGRPRCHPRRPDCGNGGGRRLHSPAGRLGQTL